METAVRVKSINAQNFASYEYLDFQFDSTGLCLIQGPTGSGKSTLCDLVPWCLFGKTAKGGSVDEIRSWPGSKITVCHAFLDGLVVIRRRGPKAKDNDLCFYEYDYEAEVAGDITRGKDLNDTQKLLNARLGMDYDLYMAGSYYHEFSQTAQFFTTSAKNRRVLCEQLTDLSLATKLQPKLIENYKSKSLESNKLEAKKRVLESNIDMLTNLNVIEKRRYETWENTKISRLEMLLMKSQEFDKSSTKTNKCNSNHIILNYKLSSWFTFQAETSYLKK